MSGRAVKVIDRVSDDAGSEESGAETPGGDMAKTLLIVDDSASMRQLITFTIKEAGHEVLLAENGKDALEKLKGAKADMVITDLNMPEMDGITLIAELRKMADYKFIPILMLTTESQVAKREEGRAAGASGWIVKPFSSEKFLEVLKKFIK
jgi:two-component system, chemotaxis family, chemotaxis protein CheY